MASAMTEVDEEALVREQIAQIKLPKGVKFSRVEQGNEWTGEPALRIYFTISKAEKLTQRRLNEVVAMHHELTGRVLSLRLGKWPFFHLNEAA